jgi:hypothetical protein
MPHLPENLDDAIVQAREATQAAIADGLNRLQVELVFPEIKIMPLAAQFITAFEPLDEKLRVFFPDPGSAALARRDWGEKPYAIRGIGELKAVIQPEEEVFVFVEPSSVEVAQVEQLCETAQHRPVVFLNPRLEDIATIGIGYAGRQLRERFLNTFESCYYLRPLPNGALFRCYPSPWQIWVEGDGGNYELLSEQPQKPIGEALDRILAGTTDEEEARPAPRKSFLSNLQGFLRALSQ